MKRVVAIALAGCVHVQGGPVPAPLSASAVTAAQAREPAVTAESLERGRRLFAANCHRCHDLPDVRVYSTDDLRRVLPIMTRRAHLSPGDAQAVTQFVLAYHAASSSG